MKETATNFIWQGNSQGRRISTMPWCGGHYRTRHANSFLIIIITVIIIIVLMRADKPQPITAVIDAVKIRVKIQLNCVCMHATIYFNI